MGAKEGRMIDLAVHALVSVRLRNLGQLTLCDAMVLTIRQGYF
jgi:hypothetical protein